MIYVNNKPITEVLRDMPWQLKIVVGVGSVFLLFSVSYIAYQLLFGFDRLKAIAKPTPAFFQVAGSKAGSFFDPAVAVDVTRNTSMLLYTARVKADPKKNVPAIQGIGFATNDARCKRSWIHKDDVFLSREETLLAPDGQSPLAQGMLMYETPAIVFDPQDTGHEWKAFAYRYFWNGNVAFAQRYSMVVMRTAPATDPSNWSGEEWVLSPAPDWPPPPYQGLVRQHAVDLHPDLASYTSYAKPSVREKGGVLLMSLSAFRGTADPVAIVLLVSYDHGKTWEYLSTPLTAAMLEKTQFPHLSGATLMHENERFFLGATLGNQYVRALGTFIIPFDDMVKGTLQTKSDGTPDIIKRIQPQSATPNANGGGFGAFDEACVFSGIISAEYDSKTENWRLYKTAKTPLSVDE